ncbi:uncharacterized protein LOC141620486 [Silene latifolia]|uniref:uncharacterized protein LOC141620486 n=1 Tax=Silene latifolia TaxID=37657 RepID=UPI003D78861A
MFVAPSEGERYFLRLLLMHIVTPTSFEDLKNVDGYQRSNFQEAAIKRKLVEDDNMVELCLDEATPKDPAVLWDKYYTSLSEDHSREHPNDAYTTRLLTVHRLEQLVEAMGKSLKSLGLEHLINPQYVILQRSQDILDALNAPVTGECLVCRNSLNTEQQEDFNMIIEHVRDNKPGAYFVDGPGGTGKTYLYNALYAKVRLMNKIVLHTATSGIGAANIPSRRTTASRFKLPLDLEISLSCAMPKQGSLAALIQATYLIIWDEASMARKESVEALDQLLQDLCNPDIIFGGKLIMFGGRGDFRQVLPVVRNKSMREVVNFSMVASLIWPHLIKFRLTINVRARTDPEFSEFLLSLVNGELQTHESELVELPDGIVLDTTQARADLISTIANTIYPDSDINDIGISIFNRRSILTPMNEDVDDINTFMINKFSGEAIMYRGFDSVLICDCKVYPSEFINKLNPGRMIPYELILKKIIQ